MWAFIMDGKYIKKTNLPYIIIANKADKIATTKVDLEIARLKKEFPFDKDTIERYYEKYVSLIES